jgi:flagellar motor switch/type III secretory pathway protein FliN
MSVGEAASLTDEILRRLVNALKSEVSAQPESWDEQLDSLLEAFVAEASPGMQSIVPTVECTIARRAMERLTSSLDPSAPALYVMARQEERGGFVLVRFGAVGVEWWLTQSLGGSPPNSADALRRRISSIGARVGRIAIDLALGSMARVLSAFSLDVAFHECKMATEYEDVPCPQDNPWVHHIVLSLSPDVPDVTLELMISEQLVAQWCEAVKSKETTDDSAAQAKSSDHRWSEGLAQQVEVVRVSAQAVLCTQSVDLNDVATWRPGSVLTLETTTDKPIELVSNEVPLFWGTLGKMDGKLCVRLGNSIEDTSLSIPR